VVKQLSAAAHGSRDGAVFLPATSATREITIGHSEFDPAVRNLRAWNAGRIVGSKRALKPQQVWAIRFWLDHERRLRDRALFDLAIDSKLRGCDVVKIRIGDIVSGGSIRTRAIVVQQKTGRPVQFELLEAARTSILAWLEQRGGALEDYAFPSRIDHSTHLSTRQYARLVDEWVTGIGLHQASLLASPLADVMAALAGGLLPARRATRAGGGADGSGADRDNIWSCLGLARVRRGASSADSDRRRGHPRRCGLDGGRQFSRTC
jgi:hypothetical protein